MSSSLSERGAAVGASSMRQGGMSTASTPSNNNGRVTMSSSYLMPVLLLALLGLGMHTCTNFFPDVSSYYQYFDTNVMSNAFGGTATSSGIPSGAGGTLHHLDISMDERVIRILNQTSSSSNEQDWKHFQHMQIRDENTLPLTPFGGDAINSTIIHQIASFQQHHHFDMTRNVPLIQDFVRTTPSKAERTFPIPPTQTTTTTTTTTTTSAGDADQTTNNENSNRKKNERLNIVLFYADDWTMKVLGKLNPLVQTPNIDAMADNGMLYSHNCVTTSICWISRATLSTGVYAAVHQHKKIGSMTMFNDTIQWPQTLYPLLKANGYYTGLVGKWHAPAPDEFMKYSFDILNIYYGDHWFKRDGKDRHVTDLNGEDALAFLQTRPKDKNFALTVSFFATHAWDYHDPPYVLL
jgi:Sulfatase